MPSFFLPPPYSLDPQANTKISGVLPTFNRLTFESLTRGQAPDKHSTDLVVRSQLTT